MAIEASATENEAEQQLMAQSTRSLRSRQLQYIPNTGEKRTVAMKLGNSDENKKEKAAESQQPKKRRVYADKSHGKMVCRQLPTRK